MLIAHCIVRIRHHHSVGAALNIMVTWEGKRAKAKEKPTPALYLLSNYVGIVGRLRLERAVVGP